MVRSLRSTQIAQQLLLRKLSGRRISFREGNFGIDPNNQRDVKAEFARLASVPQNRRDLARAASIKAEKRSITAPTLNELQAQQSFARASDLGINQSFPSRRLKPILFTPKPISFTPRDRGIITRVEQQRKQSLSRPSREKLIKDRRNLEKLKRTGVISQVDQKKGRHKLGALLSLQQGKLQTKELRTSKGRLTLSDKAQLASLSAALTIVKNVEGFISLPATLKLLKDDPSLLKKIPAALRDAGIRGGQILRTSPSTAIGIVGGELLFFKGSGKVLKVGGQGVREAQKILPGFNKVTTTPLGEKVIKGVKDVGDIELIPSTTRKPVVNPTAAVDEARIPLAKNPKMPKLTKDEQKIIDIVKKRGDTITGSLSQNILLKKKFTRKFEDLDTLTKDKAALLRDVKKAFGKRVRIKKKFRSIQIFIGKKQIADVVKFSEGEAGFAKKFGSTKFRGLNLVTPQGRLASKVFQLGLGKKGKVIKDIENLLGKKGSLDKPSFKGAFGQTKKEQAAAVGREGPVITSQEDFLGRGIIKPSQIKLKRILFASPPTKAGKGQARISRLGISADEEATLLDLLAGDLTLKSSKPQMFVFPKEKILPKGDVGKGFRVPYFSSELEVILDKGFVIARGKTLGKTEIDGKLVPIIELKKIKLDKTTLAELDKFKKGKLTKLQIKKLNNVIKKKTKFDYQLNRKRGGSSRTKLSSTNAKGTKKIVPIKRFSFSLISRGISIKKRAKPRARPRARTKSKPRSKLRTRTRPRGKLRVKPTSRPKPRPPRPKSPKPRLPRPRPRSPRPRPPVVPPKRLPSKRPKKKRKKKKKKQQAFNVLVRPRRKKGRKKPKLLKVNQVPLSKTNARNLRSTLIDNSLARSGRIKPRSGKPKAPKLKVRKGFAKRTGNKFRSYRIVKGKRVPLPRGSVIERSKFLLDSRSEKRQIGLRRRVAILTRKSRPKQTRTSMLANLKKARAVRLTKLKRRKKRK